MSDNASAYVLAELRSPWPSAVGTLSRAAAHAVLERPAAGSVQFGCPRDEFERLAAAGGRTRLLAADLGDHYAARAMLELSDGRMLSQSPPRLKLQRGDASQPPRGSIAGYLRASEADAELRRIALAHPRWASAPLSVGTTREGRPIQLVCVTRDLVGCDGAAGDADERPALLYTALLHSREPATLTCLLHFVRTLLHMAEAGEAGVDVLLSRRRLLFLPNLNPDGWAWNEQKRPKGGGMKRKNGLRSCSRGPGPSDGVDLNRNFDFKWGYARLEGSSANGCNEEYRGEAPFSEPESRAFRDVVQRHAVRAVLHWHGWGNSIAFPYAYDWRASLLASELDRYQELSRAMAARNRYGYGRAWESVGYHANGEADDWSWGERGAVSLSLEVGSSRDGFWPPPSRIEAVASASLWPAMLLAHRAGVAMQLHSLQLSGAAPTPAASDGAGGASSSRASLRLWVHNGGLAEPAAHWRLCVAPSAAGASPRVLASAGWEAAPGSGGDAGGGGGGRGGKRGGALNASDEVCAAVLMRPRASGAAPRHPRRLLRRLQGEALPLPPLELRWAARRPSSPPLELSLRFEPLSTPPPPAGAVALAAPPLQLRIATDAATLSSCDALCICPDAGLAAGEPAGGSAPPVTPWAAAVTTYASSCRAALRDGSHCAKPKRARRGPASNYASGLADEFFEYVPSTAAQQCTVSASHRGLVMVVYQTCGRFGPKQPLAFANSERRNDVSVRFPCTSAAPILIYWNAEYAPGRFAFSVTDS